MAEMLTVQDRTYDLHTRAGIDGAVAHSYALADSDSDCERYDLSKFQTNVAEIVYDNMDSEIDFCGESEHGEGYFGLVSGGDWVPGDFDRERKTQNWLDWEALDDGDKEFLHEHPYAIYNVVSSGAVYCEYFKTEADARTRMVAIEARTYGVCEMCGRDLDDEDLADRKTVNHEETTVCQDCFDNAPRDDDEPDGRYGNEDDQGDGDDGSDAQATRDEDMRIDGGLADEKVWGSGEETDAERYEHDPADPACGCIGCRKSRDGNN